MIRILHVIDSLGSGGMERQLVELLKGLNGSSEFANEVVCLSNIIHYDSISTLAKVHVLERKTRWDPIVLAKLWKIVRSGRIDIIHAWSSMGSIYAFPCALFSGAVLLNGTIRDAPRTVDASNKAYFRLRLTSLLSSVVLANSNAGLVSYRVSPKKGVCIYNGFDPARVQGLQSPDIVKSSLGIDSKIVVGMVGRFHCSKDYSTYLSVARRIIEKRPDVAFVAVGEGPDFDSFARLVEEWKSPNIHLLGARKNVEEIVNTFNIGVLVTDSRFHGEGISNAILEYMALGKPVVATDGGGNAEALIDGEQGFLVPFGAAEVLEASICKLLDDPELAAQMGEKGRKRVPALFSMDKMITNYSELYRHLCESRASTVSNKIAS